MEIKPSTTWAKLGFKDEAAAAKYAARDSVDGRVIKTLKGKYVIITLKEEA